MPLVALLNCLKKNIRCASIMRFGHDDDAISPTPCEGSLCAQDDLANLIDTNLRGFRGEARHHRLSEPLWSDILDTVRHLGNSLAEGRCKATAATGTPRNREAWPHGSSEM